MEWYLPRYCEGRQLSCRPSWCTGRHMVTHWASCIDYNVVMSVRPICGLVAATSNGEPMRSARPKPIHLLCGRPMASYVLDTLGTAGVTQAVVVTGSNGDRVSKRLLEESPAFPVYFLEQSDRLGNADAALLGTTGFDDFDDDEDLLFVPGDLPLLRPAALQALVDEHRRGDAACTLLTVRRSYAAVASEPVAAWMEAEEEREWVVRDRRDRVRAVAPGWGRSELQVDTGTDAAGNGDADRGTDPEISLGVFCIRRGLLAPALRRVRPSSDGVVRISALIEVLSETGHTCLTATTTDVGDFIPVNNRVQLADAEAELRRRANRYWLSRGVTMVDPERTYLDATVQLGTDVTLFPGTILQGKTVIGDGCEIGPDVHLDRCQVGENSRMSKTTAALAVIGSDCVVGPFAALEPGSRVTDGTVTGPFYAGSGTT